MSMTPQRERFCQCVAKHGNASEAYRVAYPRSVAWRPESVNTAASHLARTH
jgi:hypothetical protein